MPKKSTPRPQPTHFLCLPLLTRISKPQLAASIAEFRAATFGNAAPSGVDGEASIPAIPAANFSIPESAYRPLGTLHLTLGVMVLPAQERLEAALSLLNSLDLAEILQSAAPAPAPHGSKESTHADETLETGVIQTLKRAITPPPVSSEHIAKRPPRSNAQPLTISLQGLSAFPNPQKATVLLAQPHDPTGRLHNFCLALRQSFIDAGFIAPENRPLVLHATIVNTVYAKKPSKRRDEGMRRGLGRVSIDAGKLVAAYSGEHEGGGAQGECEREKWVWAKGVEIDCVRICKMGAKKVENQLLGQEYEVVGEKKVLGNDT